MKKNIILTLLILLGSTITVNAVEFNAMPYGTPQTDFGGMQSPQSQFKLLEEQRFRREEYNEFKDMKQQKDERNKKINLQQQLEETNTVPDYKQDVNLIQENGEIKIKSEDNK